MKKALLIFAILLGSLVTFAQGEISFGLATKYQSKAPSADWEGWKIAEEPILLYIDLGFGFVAVENGYKDRFILKISSTTKTYDTPEKTIYTVKASDKQAKNCTLEFAYFSTGNFALVIRYSDMHYSYWCDGEHGAHGYPYKYFNSTPPQTTPSPKVKAPSGVNL